MWIGHWYHYFGCSWFQNPSLSLTRIWWSLDITLLFFKSKTPNLYHMFFKNYLCLCQQQWRCHFKWLWPGQIFIHFKLSLQLEELLTGKCCSWSSGLPQQPCLSLTYKYKNSQLITEFIRESIHSLSLFNKVQFYMYSFEMQCPYENPLLTGQED